jgi:hypothetical protein
LKEFSAVHELENNAVANRPKAARVPHMAASRNPFNAVMSRGTWEFWAFALTSIFPVCVLHVIHDKFCQEKNTCPARSEERE